MSMHKTDVEIEREARAKAEEEARVWAQRAFAWKRLAQAREWVMKAASGSLSEYKALAEAHEALDALRAIGIDPEAP